MLDRLWERIRHLFHGAAEPTSTRAPEGRAVGTLAEEAALLSALQPCTLPQYRDIVRDLARPSTEQIGNFVEFVCGAHSWYKHLPLLPPGETFRFFLDPFAGYDRVIEPDGSATHNERTEHTPRFHYTWMTTEEYRSRFACLSYENAAATSFLLESPGGVHEYADRPIVASHDAVFRIPQEIARAGAVELTGVIHPMAAANPLLWMSLVEPERFTMYAQPQFRTAPDGSPRRWPEETGGDATLNEIRDLLFGTRSPRPAAELLRDLEALILPEKRRLQGNMVAAIERMLRLALGEAG